GFVSADKMDSDHLYNYYEPKVQDYGPMYTQPLDEFHPHYFELGTGDDGIPFYPFADMHDALRPNLALHPRTSPPISPFAYYQPSILVTHPTDQPLSSQRLPIKSLAHSPHHMVTNAIKPLPHSPPHMVTNAIKPLPHSPPQMVGNEELWIDLKQRSLPIPTPKTRGRRASTRSETHDVSRQFTCAVEDCNKVFKRSEHLKRHVRSIHTLEKPFPCPICQKSFSRTDNLNQHVRIHSRPKSKVSTIRAHPPHHPFHLDPSAPLLGWMPFYTSQISSSHPDAAQMDPIQPPLYQSLNMGSILL
ncbi:hypothetical protein L0F63_005883, partial [Massospora cicadina]